MSIPSKKPSTAPFNLADWKVTGVRLDPSLDGAHHHFHPNLLHGKQYK